MTQRLRTEGVARVVMGELAPGPRQRITDQLYALWHEYFVGIDRDAFAQSHLLDNTHVVMTLGPGGDLAGFGYINRAVIEAGGRKHLMLGGGTFSRVEYAGSGALWLGLVQETARIRLSHPGLPVVGISIATNPLVYDLTARMMATMAPREGFEPPPEALAIAHHVAGLRNFTVDPHDPWIIQWSARTAQVERLLRSKAYARRTPAMQWFESRVPDWTEGRALLVWAPLSADNLARGALRLARYRRTHG
mgnify:CR=1 FL=1